MTVYVVISQNGPWPDDPSPLDYIVAVFSSRDKADAFIAAHPFDFHEIQEFKLDADGKANGR